MALHAESDPIKTRTQVATIEQLGHLDAQLLVSAQTTLPDGPAIHLDA
jgi:hypothetical protein